MKLGSSKPWPEAMAIITGQSKMSAQPLMQYFEPLIQWLQRENQMNGDVIGWPEYDWIPQGKTNKRRHLPHRFGGFHFELLRLNVAELTEGTPSSY